jgi:flagellar hook assembly protein FlgD
VRTLVEENLSAGIHQVTWDATDNSGNRISNGVYFCKITAGTHTQMKKIIFSK